MILINYLLYQQYMTIDRVENEFAVVEWSNDSLSALPISAFSREPVEGDHYRLFLTRDTSGSCHLLAQDPIHIQCSDQTLIIPMKIKWKPYSHVQWTIQPQPRKEKSSAMN